MKDKKRLVLTTSILLSAAMAYATPYTMEMAKIIAEEATVVKVGGEAELVEAVSKGGAIELTQNIELNSVLSIPKGVSVKLNLGGYKISIQKTKEILDKWDDDRDGDYEDYITVAAYNAVNNYGILDVQNGWIYSNQSALFTSDTGTTTVTNMTLEGDNYGLWNDGVSNLTSCNVKSLYWESLYNERGTMELRDVTVNESIYNKCDASDVVIYSGSYKAVSNATLEGGTFDTDSLSGCVLNGGEYLQANAMVGFARVVVPENSSYSFTFVDGVITGASLLGGTYDGTIRASTGESKTYCYSCDVTYGSNFKMTEGLANSLESSWAYHSTNVVQHVTGKKVQAIQGTPYYTVVDCASATVKVALKNTSDSSKGSISVFIGDKMNTIYSSMTKTVNAGDTVGIRVQNKDTANSDFVIYLDDNTTPEPVTFTRYVDDNGKETDYYYVLLNALEGTHTYYVEFITSSAKVEYEAKVNAWVGDYATTTKYVVNDKEEMGYFAYAVNQGKNFKSKEVLLSTSLDYAGASVARASVRRANEVNPYDYTTSTTYLPVGNQTSAFAGTFDGQYNTISGINIMRDGYVGVFGNSKGIIKNLNVTNSAFSGSYAGGIVAEGSGTVEKCSVTNSSIEASQFGGGLIGHTYGMAAKDVTVDKVTLNCPWKSGGLTGYADGINVQNASITNVTNASTNGFFGAAVGHANAGENVLEDVQVTDKENSLIGTNYSESTGSIVVKGENTVVETKSIIPSTSNLEKSIALEGGTFVVNSVVETPSETGENVAVSGGSYNVDVSSYLDEKSSMKQDEEGQFVVENYDALKIAFVDGNISSDLGLRFYIDSAEYTKKVANGDKIYVEIKKALYNEANEIADYEVLTLDAPSYTSTVAETSYEVFAFNGIKFYEMTSDITVSCYAVDSQGTRINIDELHTTFASYAKKAAEQYKGQADKTTKIEIIKQLLTLGGLSQTDMNYHMNDLASSYIPA